MRCMPLLFEQINKDIEGLFPLSSMTCMRYRCKPRLEAVIQEMPTCSWLEMAGKVHRTYIHMWPRVVFPMLSLNNINNTNNIYI